MKRQRNVTCMALALAVASSTGCADETTATRDTVRDATEMETEASGDILDTAASTGIFSTLGMAIGSAGLTTALKAEGPFTLFAPTDAAFARLPDGLLAGLSQDQLFELLSYHVVDGDVRSGDLEPGTVEMLNGMTLAVSLDGGARVNGTSITMSDIAATNGVIHVVDEVLFPPRLLEALQLTGDLTSLVGRVDSAGLLSDQMAAAPNGVRDVTSGAGSR